jgi:hypothetical protein
MANKAYIDKRTRALGVGSGVPATHPHKGFMTEEIETEIESMNGKPKVISDGVEYGLDITGELYRDNCGYLIGGFDEVDGGLKKRPDGGRVLLDEYPEVKALYEQLLPLCD